MSSNKNAAGESSWWLVIKDSDTHTFSVSGPILDDTPYIELVNTLQKNGRNVTMETPDSAKFGKRELIQDITNSLKLKYTDTDLLREAKNTVGH
jgi:hypothetical protein